MRLKTALTSYTFLAISSVSVASYAEEFLAKENNEQQSLVDYWTPERMKNAKEMPLPLVDFKSTQEIPMDDGQNLLGNPESGDGAPPEGKDIRPDIRQLYTPQVLLDPLPEETKLANFNKGTLNYHFSSSRLIPLSADLAYPYRAVGKLFFTIPGQGDYVCSASVLRHRIIVTAGHCLHKGSGGTNGYYTNWRFVPAFRDGSAPFQTWTWSYVLVTNTWATGGGTVPNAADYGMLEMRDNTVNNTLQRIGTITGYLGYQTQALIPNHAHLLGYPCNFDSCQKMHQVTAQSARMVAPNNAEYGSDMAGGSSGGPWVQNFGAYSTGQSGGLNPGLNRIIGITSYGYVSADPKAQGSSIPDSRFTDLLNSICAHKAGNC
ncbi:trypsin-like serine peptidase [Legionella gresilensis]|uniref:trypsin-like serine peptidase n=1 Tax=Legionella gresilensis TaxID=91823 RepID=UPI00104154BE|nr:trypsin-like serine protease [Legionella gresilensis]